MTCLNIMKRKQVEVNTFRHKNLTQFDIKASPRMHPQVEATYSKHSHRLPIPNQHLLLTGRNRYPIVHISGIVSDMVSGPVIRDPKLTTPWPLATPRYSLPTRLTSKPQTSYSYSTTKIRIRLALWHRTCH